MSYPINNQYGERQPASARRFSPFVRLNGLPLDKESAQHKPFSIPEGKASLSLGPMQIAELIECSQLSLRGDGIQVSQAGFSRLFQLM